uniref:Uncharacterized protein n=1 Tax=Rhizophora mucronata TaxID=61149 RepID=A0A2P2Q529_RHIMU
MPFFAPIISLITKSNGVYLLLLILVLCSIWDVPIYAHIDQFSHSCNLKCETELVYNGSDKC